MEIAARKASPIQRLILNDIGPFVSGASRQANAALANAAGEYETEAEAVAFVLGLKKPLVRLPKKLPTSLPWIASQEHRMESGVCIMIL